jgi:glutathione S-transferase
VTLKLIGASLSPFVRKVRVVLAEKGLSYEHDPLVPFGVSDEYKRLHPLGKIPTLVDGDRVIPDSSAICVYLDRIEPQPALQPDDAYEHARSVWIEEFADSALAPGGAAFFQERVLAPVFFKRPADEARVEKAATEMLPPLFDYLEREIGEREHVVGSRFSIADVALGTQFVNYHLGGGAVDEKRWPKLAAYVARVHGRPSFKALIEEDQGFVKKAMAG